MRDPYQLLRLDSIFMNCQDQVKDFTVTMDRDKNNQKSQKLEHLNALNPWEQSWNYQIDVGSYTPFKTVY